MKHPTTLYYITTAVIQLTNTHFHVSIKGDFITHLLTCQKKYSSIRGRENVTPFPAIKIMAFLSFPLGPSKPPRNE